MEYGLITVSPEGIVETDKTICKINSDVSFDYTGKEAMANMMAIAELPILLRLALQNYVYHERKSQVDPEYSASTHAMRSELRITISKAIGIDEMILANWVDHVASVDINIEEIQFT